MVYEYGGGFAGNFLGALGQQQKIGAAQASAGDAQWDRFYQMARLEGELSEREWQRDIYEREQAAAAEKEKRELAKTLAQQAQREELRAQLDPSRQELFDVDPATAIKLQFPEPQKPGSQFKVAGTDIFDVSGDQPKLVAQGRRSGEPLVKVMTPDGPKYMKQSEAVGQTPYMSGGIHYNPETGELQIGGPPGGGLTKKTQGDVEESLIGTQQGLDRLAQIGKSYNPEFSTYQGAAKAEAFRQLEKTGIGLNPERAEYLKGYTVWRQNAGDNLSRYVKEISGAAATDAERQDLNKNLPNTEDSPTQFMAKFENKERQLKMVHARLSFIRSRGLQPGANFAGISLDQVPELIEQRGQEIEAQLLQQGVPPDQIKQVVAQQLKQEFSL